MSKESSHCPFEGICEYSQKSEMVGDRLVKPENGLYRCIPLETHGLPDSQCSYLSTINRLVLLEMR